MAYLNKGELIFEVKVRGAVPVTSLVELRSQLRGLLACGTLVPWREEMSVLEELDLYKPLLEEWERAVEDFVEKLPSKMFGWAN